MPGYFYRGRHRRPSTARRKAATIAVTGAVGLGLAPTTAYAAGPDWGPIIACESGGNPTAQNASSSASGLFQFIRSTWLAYGGGEFAATAAEATVAEQHIVAGRAYADAGYTPWNASRSCWSGRVGTPAPTPTTHAAPTGRHRVPDPPAVSAAGEAQATTAPSVSAYVVVEGDTLSEIAVALHVDGGWPALYSHNRGVVGDNPDLIFPGQRLDL